MCPTIVFKTLSSILQSHVLFTCRTCSTHNVICWSRDIGAHVFVHFAMKNGRGQNHWLEKQLWLILNGVDVMPRLFEFERHRAIGVLETGIAHNEVARRFGVHRNTIQNFWRRYQQQGNTRDRSHSSRPRVTSQAQDNHIRVTNLLNRFRPATLTARTIPGLRVISARTVRNRLLEHNIRPRRPAIRLILLRRHRNARLPWSRQHLLFTHRDWSGVLFTDKSRFHLDGSDGRNRVYRRVYERYSDACVVQRACFGGGSVMVWGGITSHGRTQLVIEAENLTAVRYSYEIIRPHVLPFLQGQHGVFILQQDNARPHVARVVTDFLGQQNVNTLPWPAVLPDLSPTEHQ